ncbi:MULTISPECIES: orotidine-5'-phosphate decarboxylase [Hallerella]|uniref:Orotidine-5'-phosphate decarboxylase n=1 Tax=Hallerella succinigenes TaxID=1896222 RepID=A0A2M9A4F7_9BACT|nr:MULTISPECIES: orotidine-5'-phosphate decarboxylase [Hallerella]MBS7391845.1 orotidine-5'-phosphate decarboxylase [Fibrobacter sp.]MCI6873068.1 orotidine-5'-phosphate decarboxylase [Hallerella sp.]MDD6092201.1 orotidine-5'-phosphate decarboxylase [Hallerella succinigenes]MDY5028910.1 orotidine-5'-phosphate decarboxylase [Hallerella succinigenes]PJJ40600.1 orotidine-5'-phosphate decarboxylase [Hallerella succinigenes]
MKFSDCLEARIQECGNPICLGMDPKLSLMPVERKHGEVQSEEEKIKFFYMDILEECSKRNVKPAVVKPNSAYYERISIQGMQILHDLIAAYKGEGIPVVLDAKRGDIGKTSAAYADAAFNVYGADAVTVSPWMGKDSVGPFLEHPANGGVYALLRTSNKGAADFQDLPVEGSTAFFSVAKKLIEWDNGNLGAVVGATHPEELERITAFFAAANHEIPFLIPGVSIPGVPGGQGGDAKTVLQAIANGGGKRKFHVLNSSSGLNFAWQRTGKEAEYASACVDAIESLAEAIR